MHKDLPGGSISNDEWCCMATFEKTANPNVEYMRAVFGCYDYNRDFTYEVNGKEGFLKAAIFVDKDRRNIVLSEQIEGFQMCYWGQKVLNNKMKQVIAQEMLRLRFEDDVDINGEPIQYNYIYPNSDKSLEVAKLVDTVFSNIINMEKVTTLLPDMPTDVQLHIVDQMRVTNKYNIATSPMPRGFIERRERKRSSKNRRIYLTEWLQCSPEHHLIDNYMEYDFDYHLN